MNFTAHQYGQALFESVHGANKAEARARIAAFVALVRRERATALFPRIIRAFKDCWNKSEGTEEIHVTSARKLSAAMRNTIVAARGADRSATVIEHDDETLIGGVRIERGDTVIDGTVRATVQTLRLKLMSTQ